MRLRRNLMNKVFDGKPPCMILTSTATGTGLGAGNKLGMCVLDRSSTNWFLCTASTGAGTWVAINA